jgi:hypothetical protein
MTEYIYLLQEREFINKDEDVYKIGKTKQPNLKRVSQYPIGSIVIIQYRCIDCSKIERELLKLFTETFTLRKDIGSEYFEGDGFQMSCEICRIIQDERRGYRGAPIPRQLPVKKIVPAIKEPVKKPEDLQDIVKPDPEKTTKGRIGCQFCNQDFKNKYSAQRHVERRHKEESRKEDPVQPPNTCKDIQCHLCFKKLSSKSYLLKHIDKCKGVKNRHQCEFCEKKFKHEKSRFHHYKICGAKKKLEDNQCHLCFKKFSRGRYLKTHIEICKGVINRLQCEYCKTDFTHENSRFRHYKTCATKKEKDLEAQQNRIPIIYNTPFLTNHINSKDFKKILELAPDNRLLSEYSKMVFKNRENQCIKKTNLKSAHSQIHTGHNKWEPEIDKNIYPVLAIAKRRACLATNLCKNMLDYVEAIKEELEKDVYDRVKDFLRDTGKEYKKFVDGLKLIVYGNTKICKK